MDSGLAKSLPLACRSLRRCWLGMRHPKTWWMSQTNYSFESGCRAFKPLVGAVLQCSPCERQTLKKSVAEKKTLKYSNVTNANHKGTQLTGINIISFSLFFKFCSNLNIIFYAIFRHWFTWVIKCGKEEFTSLYNLITGLESDVFEQNFQSWNFVSHPSLHVVTSLPLLLSKYFLPHLCTVPNRLATGKLFWFSTNVCEISKTGTREAVGFEWVYFCERR